MAKPKRQAREGGPPRPRKPITFHGRVVPDGMEEVELLLKDPLFTEGAGLPKGNGQMVFMVPSTFGQALAQRPIIDWLDKLGYDPIGRDLHIDTGCARKLIDLVTLTLDLHMRGNQKPFMMIGHAYGGVLAHVLAARRGAQCSHLILLGAPFNALRDKPHLFGNETPEDLKIIEAAQEENRQGWKQVRKVDPECGFPGCNCSFYQDLWDKPLDPATKVLQIWSSVDPIITGWTCYLPEYQPAFGMAAGHVGLILDRKVYKQIAHFLADKPLPERE